MSGPEGKAQAGSGEMIDEEILDEGCYYLSFLGLTTKEISERFGIAEGDASKRAKRFGSRLKKGELTEDMGLEFWRSVREEAEGNVKVTFVSGKGFHHSWRSDLAKLDGPTLLSIYESCKDFLNLDPNARFLRYEPPKNYDPLAMQREISRATVVIEALIKERWKGVEAERSPGQKSGRARRRPKGTARADSSPNS